MPFPASKEQTYRQKIGGSFVLSKQEKTGPVPRKNKTIAKKLAIVLSFHRAEQGSFGTPLSSAQDMPFPAPKEQTYRQKIGDSFVLSKQEKTGPERFRNIRSLRRRAGEGFHQETIKKGRWYDGMA